MPNKTSALEWLIIAYHDLKSAKILFDANHYTDSIGNDLQQALEKILKSLSAYNNSQIKKSHDLIEIYAKVKDSIALNDYELDYLEIATNYFKEDRYPNPSYSLPQKEEIKTILDFTEELLFRVCKIINVNENDLKNKENR